MITIITKIGSQERLWESVHEVEESWITEQIERSQRSGQPACVVLRLQTPDIHLTLSTPNCGGGGGGRLPNPQEKRIVDLWYERELNGVRINPGQLIAFLAQAKHLL